jgi:hypothetical protein
MQLLTISAVFQQLEIMDLLVDWVALFSHLIKRGSSYKDSPD